jgi:hypothetical protein
MKALIAADAEQKSVNLKLSQCSVRENCAISATCSPCLQGPSGDPRMRSASASKDFRSGSERDPKNAVSRPRQRSSARPAVNSVERPSQPDRAARRHRPPDQQEDGSLTDEASSKVDITPHPRKKTHHERIAQSVFR